MSHTQREFVTSVNQTHPHQKAKTELDWQDQSIFKFHNSFVKRESKITQAEGNQIVRGISRKWGVRVEQLYPDRPSNFRYSWGASLGPRQGVIWLDSDMCYPSYMFHELAHVVVECFRLYDLKGTSTIREEGHGVLFSSILYHWLCEYYQDDDHAMSGINYWFKEPKIYMADSDAYLNLKKLFKKRTLL